MQTKELISPEPFAVPVNTAIGAGFSQAILHCPYPVGLLPGNWQKNFELLIHELAHHKAQSNDHLRDQFYSTVTELGAKLARLALEKPELFPSPSGVEILTIEANIANEVRP